MGTIPSSVGREVTLAASGQCLMCAHWWSTICIHSASVLLWEWEFWKCVWIDLYYDSKRLSWPLLWQQTFELTFTMTVNVWIDLYYDSKRLNWPLLRQQTFELTFAMTANVWIDLYYDSKRLGTDLYYDSNCLSWPLLWQQTFELTFTMTVNVWIDLYYDSKCLNWPLL